MGQNKMNHEIPETAKERLQTLEVEHLDVLHELGRVKSELKKVQRAPVGTKGPR